MGITAACAAFMVGAFALVLTATGGQNLEHGKTNSSPVELRMGAEKFRVPKNYLDAIYAPQSEGQKIIRLLVYYPDFTPARSDQQPRFDVPPGQPFRFTNQVDHLLTISVVPQTESPWISVDRRFENLVHQGIPVQKLESVADDLLEIHDSMFPNARSGDREFVGNADGTKVLILCQDPGLNPPPPGVVYFCQYDFPFLDLKVNVHFGQASLADWLNVYKHTVALLLQFKED